MSSPDSEVQPEPYEIAVSDDLLAWIHERVRTARIPSGKSLLSPDEAAEFGHSPDTATRIRDYWATKYDWRAVERQINAELRQFTVPITHNNEALSIHFVHHRSSRPGAIPLMFIHGWPGSILEVRPIIKSLTEPEDESQQAYHVVAPSLVGFCFSAGSEKRFSPVDQAAVFHALMLRLKYKTYMVQGGDWGSNMARIMAINYPEACPAVHINMVVTGLPSALWSPLKLAKMIISYSTGLFQTEYEARMVKRMLWWQDREMGYSVIQGTKPLTLQYALGDSPFGLLCWMREKMDSLVGEEYVWTEEETITLAMPYIINGTQGHAEIYKYSQNEGRAVLAAALDPVLPRTSSFGASIFPNDVFYAPKWLAKAKIAQNIVFWKEHDKGGHFPSLEKPRELVEDVRAFTANIDKPTLDRLRASED